MDEAPITDACTLPSHEQPLRLAEFDELFSTAVRRVVLAHADVVELHLADSEGIEARVLDLMARESRCCSFFEFGLARGVDGDWVATVRVPAARRATLDALAERALALSSSVRNEEAPVVRRT